MNVTPWQQTEVIRRGYEIPWWSLQAGALITEELRVTTLASQTLGSQKPCSEYFDTRIN